MSNDKGKQKIMPQQWDCPLNSCDGFLQLYGEPGEDGKLVAKSVFCSRDRSTEKPCPLRLLFSKYPGTCKACNVDMNLVGYILGGKRYCVTYVFTENAHLQAVRWPLAACEVCKQTSVDADPLRQMQ